MGNEYGMLQSPIEKIMSYEKKMLDEYQQGGGDVSKYRKNIECLLTQLGSCASDIKTTSELENVCGAIVRWKFKLSNDFNIFSKVQIPSIEDIPELQN